ncbi:MAG TPA: hypothetical protein VMZ53_10185 [Kofleriaceae bacterium]|nr:hypothetical protein [Kofleriaceae bacterium]
MRTLATIFVVFVAACTGEVTNPGVSNEEMAGAGGRNIAEYWPSIDVPLSQNTRMLGFDMMRSEVKRVTGRSWVVAGVDQWERNRGSLGGADFETTFSDDLTPSQQRLVLVRKMAFQVCGDLVAAEAGVATREVFTELDPGAAFDPASATTEAQIRALFKRFFLEEPAADDISDAKALLATLAPGGTAGRTAWRGLCTSYLASMRFLTY